MVATEKTLHTIVFALTGDVCSNSRAIRQIRALEDAPARIIVLTLGSDQSTCDLGDHVEMRVLKRPPGAGPRFFYKVHRLFSKESREIGADVYHASDIYVLPAMAKSAKRHQARLVFDSRELYPHVASTANKPWSRLFWHFVSKVFLPKADLVYTVSDSIADYLAEYYRITRPTINPNVPEIRNENIRVPGLRERIKIKMNNVLFVHQGKVMADRGCFTLVEAMNLVDGCSLVFLGDGPILEELKTEVHRRNLENVVFFLPPVHPDELLAVTSSADIGLTMLEDTCLNHHFALPNKLFEYVFAGLPVLASNLPEISKIVSTYEVGLTVDAQNPEAIAAALRTMATDTEARQRWSYHSQKVRETFSPQRISNQFVSTYRTLLDRK